MTCLCHYSWMYAWYLAFLGRDLWTSRTCTVSVGTCFKKMLSVCLLDAMRKKELSNSILEMLLSCISCLSVGKPCVLWFCLGLMLIFCFPWPFMNRQNKYISECMRWNVTWALSTHVNKAGVTHAIMQLTPCVNQTEGCGMKWNELAYLI